MFFSHAEILFLTTMFFIGLVTTLLFAVAVATLGVVCIVRFLKRHIRRPVFLEPPLCVECSRRHQH